MSSLAYPSARSPQAAQRGFTRLDRLLFVAVCSLATASLLPAATLIWNGTGTQWSNASSWNPASVPANGDDLVYGAAGGGDSFANLSSLSLRTLRFDAAVLPLHKIHVTGSLTFAGPGILNDSTVVLGGVIRQELYIDAGGTLVFQNNATIGGATLPVDLIARTGGAIRFEGNSTASSADDLLFTGLRIQGGELRFQDDAWTGNTAGIAVHGGETPGAVGGSVVFQDRSVLAHRLSNGTGLGRGGRVVFRNTARMQSGAALENYGAQVVGAGTEAIAQFFATTQLASGVQNHAAAVAGGRGGRLELHDQADATDVFILNWGSNVGGAEPGRVQFFDQSTASAATISNATETEGEFPNSAGGVTEFFDTTTADLAKIHNSGAAAANASGGQTFFRADSNAQNATVTNEGGRGANAAGGLTEFSGNANADNATLHADGGITGGFGARIVFRESSRGGNARVNLLAGDPLPGTLDISQLAGAGTTLGSIEGGGAVALGSKALTVGGNGLSTEFSGVVRDGGLGGGTGGSLIKIGASTLTLSGSNTYTGASAVNAGRLFVNGALAKGAVSVANGATLGGNGAIAGPVSVADGATLAPGPATGTGTLTAASLTLGPAANLAFDLGAPGPGGNDRMEVTGNLTLDGVLHLRNAGGLSFGLYRLFNYAGSLNNLTLAIGTVPTGFVAADFTVDVSTPGQVNLIVSGGPATLLYWDGPNTVANNLVDGGSGNWNTVTRNWTNAAGTGNRTWNGSFGIFAGVAGTVTLTESVALTGAQFSTDGYTLNASGGAALTLPGATVFRVEPTKSATINVPLTGSGSFVKTDTGTLTLTAASTYTGGTRVENGWLIVRNSAGRGLGTGTVTTHPQLRQFLIFAGNASAGAISLTNLGESVSAGVAVTEFWDTSTAGNATIVNQASTGATGQVGWTVFRHHSTAGDATFDNPGAIFPNQLFPNGQLAFADDSTAGQSIILNRGGNVADGIGGKTVFVQRASAGSANIILEGGNVNGAQGGLAYFWNTATAGNASFTNRSGPVSGGEGGNVVFHGFLPGDRPSAGNATFLNEGGKFGTGVGIGLVEGKVQFRGTATAGAASFVNQAGQVSGAHGGRTYFYDTSDAGTAQFVNESGPVSGAWGGVLRFFHQSSAGSARLTNKGTDVVGAVEGGVLYFNDTSTAGNATIENLPGAAKPGVLTFYGSSNAGDAQIVNHGAAANGIESAGTAFVSTSTAGNARITNRGSRAMDRLSAYTYFGNSASAGTATIVNEAPPSTLGTGGTTTFFGNASAGSATLIAQSGPHTAGVSYIGFFETSTAGAATLIAEGGVGNGNGGYLHFTGSNNGGLARVIVHAGDRVPGILNIDSLSTSNTTVGSIEGSGYISLGQKLLIVGGNNRSTEFSGIIGGIGMPTGIGPHALTKSGTGKLVLSGTNTYTGLTRVDGGTLAVNGSIAGNAYVNTGAILRGIGTIGGVVQIGFGGIYAPGTSPGTLTVGGLEFDAGSILEYELGTAASDQTIVNGNLILDGVLHIVNAGGLAANGRYDLFRWTGTLTDRGLVIGSVPPGFSPTDFRFEFANGSLRLAVDRGGVATPVIVTSSLQISATGLRLNRTTKRFVQTLTLRNASAAPIAGPVSLVFDTLPANVTLHAASGKTTALPPLNSPFLDLNLGDSTLSVGETLTLHLEFANPSNQSITYTLRALAGTGTR